MPPKLIITRPEGSAARFAEDVQDGLGRHVDCVFSPVYEIVFLPITAAEGALVFTSANGVAAAVRAGIGGNRAWCVGDRTAEVAREAGFNAISAGGNVEDLCDLITTQHHDGPLLHIAGQHTVGDLAERLRLNGIACVQITGYAQHALPPTNELIVAAKGSDALVIPLFSPRAALILAANEMQAPVHVVAMSRNIGDAATDFRADTVVVAKSPTYVDMVGKTCHVMSQLFDRAG